MEICSITDERQNSPLSRGHARAKCHAVVASLFYGLSSLSIVEYTRYPDPCWPRSVSAIFFWIYMNASWMFSVLALIPNFVTEETKQIALYITSSFKLKLN